MRFKRLLAALYILAAVMAFLEIKTFTITGTLQVADVLCVLGCLITSAVFLIIGLACKPKKKHKKKE